VEESAFLQIKQLEVEVVGVLSPIDIYSLDRPQQKLVTTIKQDLVDARLDVRDYELAETRTEQLENAQAAKQRLEVLRKHILAASEYNLFSAVDVAQLTAHLDTISGRLN